MTYNEQDWPIARFGFLWNSRNKVTTLRFNLANVNGYWSSEESVKNDKRGWSSEGSVWNQQVVFKEENSVDANSVVGFTVIYDNNNEMEKLFLNGEFEKAEISSKYWENFVDELDGQSNLSIIIGKGLMGSTVSWHYSKIECYAMRVYSRALTDSEVVESYNASVSYHKFLEDNK